MDTATVDVKSAWASKINWGELIKVGAALLATKGIDLSPEVQNDILMLIIAGGGVYTWVVRTWFTDKVTAASVAKVVLVGFALSFLLAASPTKAADVAQPNGVAAINKALSAGYPAKCGAYYGLGTGGNAGAVNGAGAMPGEQIVQGELDALVGYTCPFAQNAFWFAEAQFGFSNLNGSSNGLALSGPLVAIERAGVGSPIQALLGNLLPNLNFPAVPSAPSFPSGVAPTTAPQSYGFAGLVEQDIGAQIGALSGHQWVIAPIIGVGLLTRYSNNMMVDTWAGWQMNSNSFCPGGGASCAKLGNMARIGVSLKY